MALNIIDGQYGGIILGLLAAGFVVCVDALAQNLIQQDDLSAPELVFWRMTISLILLLLTAYYQQPEVFAQIDMRALRVCPPKTDELPRHASSTTLGVSESTALLTHEAAPSEDRDPRRAKILWARALLNAVCAIGSYTAYGMADLSDIVAITSTKVFTAALLGWLVLGERFSWRMGTAACISTVAVMCIVQPSFLFASPSTQLPSTRYIAYALSFAMSSLQVVTFLMMRKVGKGVRVISVLLPYTATAVVMSAIFLCAQGTPFLRQGNPIVWIKLVLLTIVSFICQSLLVMALQRETAARISMVSYMQIVFAVAVQIVFVGINPGGMKIAAMATIIVVGIWPIVTEKMGNPAVESSDRKDGEP